MQHQIKTFLEAWQGKSQQTKESFIRLKKHLADKEELRFDFKARPGVSYSLRARHNCQKTRQLFVIMDVIDDDPASRWLSVCFYPNMITDPEDRGHLIPLGLLGEDGYCFDFEGWDEDYLQYLEKRLDEAHRRASQEAADR